MNQNLHNRRESREAPEHDEYAQTQSMCNKLISKLNPVNCSCRKVGCGAAICGCLLLGSSTVLNQTHTKELLTADEQWMRKVKSVLDGYLDGRKKYS